MLLTFVITVLIATTPVSGNTAPERPPGETSAIPVSEEEEIYLLDHFPLTDGLRWKYRSNLGEVTSWVVVNGDQITIISESSPLEIKQYLRLMPEGLFLTESESDTFLFSTHRTYHPFLLRFPLRVSVGQHWKWEGKEVVDGDIIESKVEGRIVGWEEIIVPAGKFWCLNVHVKTVSDDGTTSSSTQWLASGVGIVKADIAIDAGGLTGFIITLLGYDTYHLELEEMVKP